MTEMSLAGRANELSIGLRSGELVVFRWGNSNTQGREDPVGTNQPAKLTPITHRTDPGLKTGFIPLTLLDMQQGPVTALKHSEVGFVAAGFEGGSLVIIDLRGPAIIHTVYLSELQKAPERSSFVRKKSGTDDAPPEWPTHIEFGVMTLEGEDYGASVALSAQTEETWQPSRFCQLLMGPTRLRLQVSPMSKTKLPT